MNPLLIVGMILIAGFLMGELAKKMRLPKVTGYLLAGILLNPGVTPLVPKTFTPHTDWVTDLSLAFIAFSVGGTLAFPKLRAQGKTILAITLCEATGALLFVGIGMALLLTFAGSWLAPAFGGMAVTVALLLAPLASPTDPSASLAVAHEFKAEGEVTRTILGAAALDDITGIINYSLCVAAAHLTVGHADKLSLDSLAKPLIQIFGGIALGVVVGLILNLATRLFARETVGSLVVLLFAFIGLCFGLGHLLGVDELLASMAMGCTVVNLNPRADDLFELLERYTEELIFVLFFVISGMHLQFSALGVVWPLIICFVILRASGKYLGTMLGAHFTGASAPVRRYTALGLIPQGGIVIGLALMIKKTPAFEPVADALIAVVIGATVIHELAGPIFSLQALRRAGEIPPDDAS